MSVLPRGAGTRGADDSPVLGATFYPGPSLLELPGYTRLPQRPPSIFSAPFSFSLFSLSFPGVLKHRVKQIPVSGGVIARRKEGRERHQPVMGKSESPSAGLRKR